MLGDLTSPTGFYTGLRTDQKIVSIGQLVHQCELTGYIWSLMYVVFSRIIKLHYGTGYGIQDGYWGVSWRTQQRTPGTELKHTLPDPKGSKGRFNYGDTLPACDSNQGQGEVLLYSYPWRTLAGSCTPHFSDEKTNLSGGVTPWGPGSDGEAGASHTMQAERPRLWPLEATSSSCTGRGCTQMGPLSPLP